jgi:hypothetical protein
MISPLWGFLSWQKIRKHIKNRHLKTTMHHNNNKHAPVLPLQGELEGVFLAGAVPMTIVDAIRAFQTNDLQSINLHSGVSASCQLLVKNELWFSPRCKRGGVRDKKVIRVFVAKIQINNKTTALNFCISSTLNSCNSSSCNSSKNDISI